MIPYAADFDTRKSRASCRIVKYVRQQTATSSVRSSRDRLQGRPLPTDSAPSRRRAVTRLPKERQAQPGERGYTGRLRRQNHTSHNWIIPVAAATRALDSAVLSEM